MKRLLTLFLLLPIITNATCIIAMKKGNAIYVAADSRRSISISEGNARKSARYQLVCKIHNVGSIYYAIAGHDDAALYHIAEKILKSSGSLETKIKRYGVEMTGYYTKLVAKNIPMNSPQYNRFLKEALGSVLIFGFNGNQSYLLGIQFLMHPDRSVSYITALDGASKMAGLFEHLDKLPDAEIKRVYAGTTPEHPETLLENLIKAEMHYHPDRISYPINIIKVTPHNAIWLKKAKNLVDY